jgi:uncharacterized membrane protein
MAHKKILWIDILKTAAMLIVLLDHTFSETLRVMYPGMVSKLSHMTICSIPMFIFLAGVNLSLSLKRQEKLTAKYFLLRLKKIIVPYIVASIILYFFVDGNTHIGDFLYRLITFRVSFIYYYVFVYIMLLLASPLIFKLLKRIIEKPILIIGVSALVIFISFYFNTHLIMPVFNLAASNILGGSLFIMFYFGMLFSFYLDDLKSKPTLITILTLSLMGAFVFITTDVIFSIWANPPAMLTIVYTLFILGVLYSAANLISVNHTKTEKILSFLTIPGKRSLHIFLYHQIILIALSSRGILMQPSKLNIFLMLMIALIGAILISYLLEFINRSVKKVVTRKSESSE